MKRFKSNAEWPKGTCDFLDNVSEDKHSTYEEAKAVCSMLERDGHGGDGEIFPLRTWVSRRSWVEYEEPA